MIKKYYHATPFENLESILDQGICRKYGYDGVIYLTEKPEEAARFVAIRGYVDILVCEVEVEEYMVEESFDHSEAFFKCRAYGYSEKDIMPDEITNYIKYSRPVS
jgi:hypothetical protein